MSDSGYRRERVLAIDYGERRVGLAVSNPDYDFVSGLPTLDRKTLKGSLVAAIGEIVVERGVERVVLGIPYTMEGEEGPQAREVRAFQAELESTLEVPVAEWDERLTTEAARRALREAGHTDRTMRERLDQLAAVLMLESWLRRRAVDRGGS
ncbi:MAG: Holliday junction resolvase RuvX [Gemmatimonadetes bacterium]|nr:Holliday junction resolvase RuvX [Gemmatimonadota bacterium]